MQRISDNGVDPGTMERLHGMLATLPKGAREMLIGFFTHAYETMERVGPDRIDQGHVAAAAGETSFDELLDEVYTLVQASDRFSQGEREHLRRVRAKSQLLKLLYTDDGQAPLTSAQMAEAVGKTPQVLNRQAKAGRYVSAPVKGANRFPLWQFTDNGAVPTQALSALFAPFGAPRRWQWVIFLRTPQPELDDAMPMEWVKAGKPTEAAERLARKECGLIEAL